MSGRKAKAKRKSAKKEAAAKPTPASAGARLDEFIIDNVRCFAGKHRVPIRPITLLVGENSTGKTTFLGCYQRFIDSLSMPPVRYPEGAFSRPPFDMGGFREIARATGGGKRRHREFRLSGSLALARPRPGTSALPLSLLYSFREYKGETSVSLLHIGFPDGDKLLVTEIPPEEFKPDQFIMVLRVIPGGGANSPAPRCALRIPDLGLRGLNYNQVVMNIVLSDWNNGENSIEDFPGMQNFLKGKFSANGRSPAFRDSALHENMQMFFSECVAVAPIRPMPHRNYEPVINGSPDYRFLVNISRMSRVNPQKWGRLRDCLVKFGVQSEMFSDFNIKNHGKGADAPFSMRVGVWGSEANIADVGYGVSQLIPFLGQVVDASLEKNLKHFLFQQPEDHLHPRAQVSFASFIADSAKNDGHTFLVETHSDFIVNRIRTHVARGDIPPDDVSLLYFERQKTGGAVKIHRIELNRNGEPAAPPKGYRDFFLHETQRVLGLRMD